MSIELMMTSNHLILLLLLSIFPRIRERFPVSQLFTLGGHSIGASTSASVLPMNIQGCFSLGLTGLISLQSKQLSRVFFSTTVRKHQFFSANRLDAPKTVTSAQFFSRTTPHHRSPTNWAMEFCFIHHFHLTSHHLTTTFSSILTHFCRENASTTSRTQKMLSKSWSNPEALMFFCCRNKCISCWQKYVDCNGSCFN